MKKTAEESPERVPQEHGGSLLSSGKPGNRGGTGRPSNIIRQRCAQSFESRIAVAEAIADDSTAKPSERLAALELLAKLSGLTVLSFDPYEAEEERQDRLKERAKRREREQEFDTLLGSFRL